MTKLDETLMMLKELTDAKGIPGNEREPREVMKKYIEPFADEIEQDGLGSLIAKKTGEENGPKIMVAGHLDEVGFMVSKIDDKGFLSFQTVGGWWSQVMLAQRVTIVTRKGDTVTGVIGSKPPHILSPEARKKPVDIKDMFIDVGATSKEEAMEWGILPGDMVVPYFEFTVMNNEKYLLAKAWDNRIGCAIAIDVMKALKDENTRISFLELGLHKKKLVFVGHEQQQRKSSRTSDLQLMLESLAIRQASRLKKQLVKWVMVHKFYYLTHQWYRIKDCVILLWIQQKKMASLINSKRFQAVERTQVQFIFLEMVYHHLRFVFLHAIFTRMRASYTVTIMKIQ